MASNYMLEGSIWDKLLKFAIPLALTNILQQLFNSADIAIVGQYVGNHALAAVGANGVVLNLLINLFVGLSIGSNVLIANLIGRNDPIRISNAIHTSVALSLLSGVILATVGGVFARDILLALSTPLEIIDDATIYLRILCIGMPFLMIFNFASAILRSKGDAKSTLWVMCITGIINVILNLLFVLGFGMSVDGVAYATAIATAFGSLILVVILARASDYTKFKFKLIKIHTKELRYIAKIGVPAGIQGMMFSLSNVCIQTALNKLGADYIAASAAALNYEFLIYFLLNAFAMASVTFIGQNFGAGNMERCRKIVKISLLMDGVITVVVSSLVAIFAEPCLVLFTTDPILLDYGALRLRYILSFELINVIIEILSGALRGVGISLTPAIICFFGICCFRIVWVYTVFVRYSNFDILMMVYPISWLITALCLIAIYVVIMRKLTKKYAKA